MAHRQVLFLTTTDLGGTQAVLPVLKRLIADQEWEGVVFVTPGSPAEAAYRRVSIPTKGPADYGYPMLDLRVMRAILAEQNPDAVLVGISSDDDSADRLVLEAARKENIPCAAIVETFPEVWLARYGDRDAALYRQADRLFVPDALSVDIAVKHGFDAARVRPAGNPADDTLAEEVPLLPWRRSRLRHDCGIPPDATVVAWFGTYDLDNPDHRGPTFEGRYGFGEAEAYREYLEAIRDGAKIASAEGRALRGLFRQKPTYGSEGIRKIERELETFVVHDDQKDGPFLSIAAADLVCSLIGGTSLHQAAKLGVPGVFYQPGATSATDDQATNRLGITKPLYERGALYELILRIARDPSEVARIHAALRPATIERGATERVIAELRALRT